MSAFFCCKQFLMASFSFSSVTLSLIHILKADACTSSKELYEVYRMWCEENSLNAIKARGFSDALIANQRRYNLESTNNIVNSSGRRVRGFVGIEALVQPDLTSNVWRV